MTLKEFEVFKGLFIVFRKVLCDELICSLYKALVSNIGDGQLFFASGTNRRIIIGEDVAACR